MSRRDPLQSVFPGICDSYVPRSLTCDKTVNYSNKTLIGNWFEEQKSSYIKQKHDHQTTYNTDYVPKPYSANSENVIWDQKFKGEGSEFVSKYGYYELPNYFENFTAQSDLAHNHFPNWYRDIGPIQRVYNTTLQKCLPDQEYLEPYTNLTKFGLVDYKRQEWQDNTPNYRIPEKTTYEVTFKAPRPEDYIFPRIGIPMPNSSIMHKPNQHLARIVFRSEKHNNVPPPQELIEVDREKRCNVITWECPWKCIS